MSVPSSTCVPTEVVAPGKRREENILQVCSGSSIDAIVGMTTGESLRVSSTQTIECLKATAEVMVAKKGNLDWADCIRISQASPFGHPHSTVLLLGQLPKICKENKRRYIILSSGHVPAPTSVGHGETVDAMAIDMHEWIDVKAPVLTQHVFANKYWWIFRMSPLECGIYSKRASLSTIPRKLDAMMTPNDSRPVGLIRVNIEELKRVLGWTRQKESKGHLPEMVLLIILDSIIQNGKDDKQRHIRFIPSDPALPSIVWVVPKPLKAFDLPPTSSSTEEKKHLEISNPHVNQCANCGITKIVGRCQRCSTVHYCSKECQKAHWKKVHKSVCRAPHVASDELD